MKKMIIYVSIFLFMELNLGWIQAKENKTLWSEKN